MDSVYVEHISKVYNHLHITSFENVTNMDD